MYVCDRLVTPDIESLIFLATIGVAIIVIALIVFSFVYLNVSHTKYVHKISDSSNSLRVFIIDSKNDQVRYFNRSRLEKKKTSTITEFYNQFPANEREKIVSWIGNLLDNTPDTPQYLEINVLINYNKKSFFSLLQVEKVDRVNGVIYLESYLLKYM